MKDNNNDQAEVKLKKKWKKKVKAVRGGDYQDHKLEHVEQGNERQCECSSAHFGLETK